MKILLSSCLAVLLLIGFGPSADAATKYAGGGPAQREIGSAFTPLLMGIPDTGHGRQTAR